MKEYREICVDVWGDFASFTKPHAKVERETYEFPTPSACRGILNSIYCKPIEFYYEITQIDVLNPIRTITLMINELNDKVSNKECFKKGYCINTKDGSRNNTQRMSEYLRDVHYRIHANIVKREDAPKNVNINSLEDQFNRRVSHGQCFRQPFLGTSDCLCCFGLPEYEKKPIAYSRDYGVTLYDIFDLTKNIKLNTSASKKLNNQKEVIHPTYFRANMVNGTIKVPCWGSNGIIGGEYV